MSNRTIVTHFIIPFTIGSLAGKLMAKVFKKIDTKGEDN